MRAGERQGCTKDTAQDGSKYRTKILTKRMREMCFRVGVQVHEVLKHFPSLAVVLPHLLGENFRTTLINFYRCFPPSLGNASLFTKFLFTIFVPLDPPPPNQQNEGFPLEFLLKGPQTKLRTLSQNCEQTLQKLRTNRIANKRAFPSFLWKNESVFTRNELILVSFSQL